ncbi:DNA polymerase III subunit delta [Methylobacterium brachythecii]|uniref:DNA-directed DNA polymerase n=1 Tax=Methylobacterium brachythecii TaxID=1176177 RepID=A0A7W6AH02_9HYPH|nr:DNA polymerase III subunit delta [Methylobacterium brachythecii]MBB3900841.1 DNA polymerase-3 subunit delta [Methylobacterium brachythecii]GLS46063.1 DNA polymerase III subunit delta [Methylobacterium brachythecii]
MTAVRPGDIEGLLRRGPDPRILLVLVYGPDIGLVADRAARLVKGMASDPDDPFALVKLDGDALASDPGRLVDEAGTIGLFGGSRTIWVRSGSRNYAPAVDAVLKSEPDGACIVVEAGDLAKSSPLRALCEKSSRALAIPCYPDDARTLSELIETTLRERGLGIDRDARELLAQSLGADRRASLSEIDKLALYAQGRERVELDDVEAIVCDVGASVLNTLIDASFAGRMAETEREARRFRQEGLDPSAMLGAALRHALALLNAKLDDPSASASTLVANWRGLHFRRKSLVETQLARWSPGALRHAVAALQESVLACRRADADLAHAHASSALLRIAGEAARRRG